GAFTKPSSGRRNKPIHSISKQYSIQTLERVYKYYYYIIRGEIYMPGYLMYVLRAGGIITLLVIGITALF
ncbi:MAG: hypothetical protein ACOX8E_13295, partial [Ruminococcus sp.]